jgi:hypothetical protein
MCRSIDAVHPLERFLAILGALACLVLTIAIWRSVSAYQAMWPLPGLYFIELPALAIFCAFTFIRGGPLGRILPWVAVGIFAAFCILGAFSVGFAYLPIVLIFAIISVSSSVRLRQPVATSLGVCLIAGLAQAALMLAAIRLLNPGAAF